MPGKMTTAERVIQIHNELVGMDGRSGIVGEMRDAKKSRTVLHGKQDEAETQLQDIQTQLSTTIVTKDDCKATREKIETKDRVDEQWTWQKKAIVMTIRYGGIAAVTGVAGFLINLARAQ